MHVLEQTPDGPVIKFTSHEIVILNNALNEALEALPDWEFSIRMGASQKEARQLLSEIGSVGRQSASEGDQ